MGKFVKFLGNCALAGKQIAVYENGDGFKLSAETLGGGPVLYNYIDKYGKKHTVQVRDLELSESEFDSFAERVTTGLVGNSDVRVVQRALIEMGYPSENFE